MTIALIVIAVVVALLLVWGVYLGNRLVRLRNEAHQALSGIDIQLQRRADLIPNLVQVVQGYAAHESATFQAVTESRARLMTAQSVAEKGAAAAETSVALGRLIAVAEAYPELRANQGFLKLQQQLTDIEDLLASARNYYNAVVQRYNSASTVFPTNLLAGSRFPQLQYFQGDAALRSAAPPAVAT
jgi:LemA protein